MKKIIALLLPALVLSCQTTDMNSWNQESRYNGELYVEDTYEIIVIDRPVYIPEGSSLPEPSPASGRQAVRNSNAEGIILPSEYSSAAIVYDYNADWVYEVYAQPLRVSDIRLEPGERAVETPFISDSERWILGAGISYENGGAVQHIYVKPVQASLEASLIINTDRRSYHIILKSYADTYMPMVRWRYPLSGLPNNLIPSMSGGTAASAGSEPLAVIDPRFVSFNYTIRSGLFFQKKPAWFPESVYDDGWKTYIVFPRNVLQRSLPAVFEGRNNVVNYRVVEHVVILDKLIERITVKLDGREIVIEKKQGG